LLVVGHGVVEDLHQQTVHVGEGVTTLHFNLHADRLVLFVAGQFELLDLDPKFVVTRQQGDSDVELEAS
jgi:hypothetical protein